MRKLLLLAGAACMGLAAPASADPGGKGGGKDGGGKPQAAKVQKGGGNGGGKAVKAERGGPKAERGAAAAPRQDRKAERQAQRPAKSRPAEGRAFKDDKRKDLRQADGRGRELRDERRRVERVYRERDDRRFIDLRDGDRRYADRHAACPPGLAKKRNGCLPPGQAKKLFSVGDRIQPAWFSGYDLPVRYRAFYRDTPGYFYRYDADGYIYRVDAERNLINSIIPLFGGGFAVGQPIPSGYDIYNVPYAYRNMYYDTDDYHYRYGDNAIYQVDAGSGLIAGIVSLLSGDLGVGQRLPAGYDAYNVPLDYRDRYYDTDDHLYRYADNAIYQVDPETMLIQAIVEMLV